MRLNHPHQDLHLLDPGGKVAGHLRGREVVPRARMEDMATPNPNAVTSKKCRHAARTPQANPHPMNREA